MENVWSRLVLFVEIFIASSHMTGIILPISRKRFVTTESEDIYPWPDMLAGEIFLSSRIRWLMGDFIPGRQSLCDSCPQDGWPLIS